MAITATERTQIIELVVGLFDAAPGATFLNDFAAYIDGGASMQDLANALTSDPIFTSPAYFPAFMTNAEFAAKFVDGLFEGGTISTTNRQWAYDWVTGKLNGGQTQAEVTLAAIQALSDPSLASNAGWASVHNAFMNRVEVADYFSVTKGITSTNLSILTAAIGEAGGPIPPVTDNPASVAVAKAMIDAGMYAPAAYSLAASATSVNEGGTAFFTLTTNGVMPGSEFAYTISGVSADDILGGSLTGTATVGADGKAVIQVTTIADNVTEGPETMTLSIAGQTAAVAIADTSTSPPATYSIAAAQPGYNEGQVAVFNVVTTNVPAGTLLSFTISGDVQAADIVGGALSGTATVGADGKATISIELAADLTTEGAETMTVTLTGPGAATSTEIADTSLTPVPTFGIAAAQAGYNEGEAAVFNVETTNVAAGTVLSYTISGVQPADVVGGSLSGTATVGADGRAVINVGLAADQMTEGNETLTVTLTGPGVAASTEVVDTSRAPDFIGLTAAPATVTEGNAVTFTLETKDVAAGTVVNYSIGGVSAADIDGPMTGSATVGSDGKATVTITTANDGVFEGDETLQLTVTGPGGQSAQATATVQDNPVFRLTAGQDGTAGQPKQATTFDGAQELTGFGLVNTLNDTDHLMGIGNATLNAVIGNAGGVTLVTPGMTLVGTVNVEFANSLKDAVALSLEDTTFTNTVNVTRISGGLSATVRDMDKSVTSLSAANTVLPVPNIIFDYRDGQAPTMVTLGLTNVTVDNLAVGEGAVDSKGKAQIGTGITTLNVTSVGTNLVGTSTKDGLDSAITNLNLTVNPGTLTIAGLNVPTVAYISSTGAGNLVLGEVGSNANFALQAGTMTGNVTAAIDNAAPNAGAVFNTGAGADKLTTATALSGDINTDGGGDNVSIAGDVNETGSVGLGTGSDTLTVGGTLRAGGANGVAALVDGGDDADSITIGGGVEREGAFPWTPATILGGSGGDTIVVGGSVSGYVDSGADGDAVYVNGGVAGDGVVYTQGGGDYLQIIGNTAGVVDLGTESDSFYVSGDNSGSFNLGSGDDSGTIAGTNTGTLTGGDGNDWVWVYGQTSGTVAMGNDSDVFGTLGRVVQTTGGATVDMGAGADFFEHNVASGLAAVEQNANTSVVQGGSESDAFIARLTGGGTYNIPGPGVGITQVAVQGFEHMWLTNNAGTFNIDFASVDGSLSKVHLNTYDFTTGTYNLTNLAGEALALTDMQASDGRLSNVSGANFDQSATADVNVTSAIAGTLNMSLEGEQAFTVNLDDTKSSFASLALNVVNTNDNQTVNFAGGANDFATLTTVTGSAAGRTITLNGVDSQTVNAAIAANMNIIVGARTDDLKNFALDRTIITGTGDDVVDYRAAFLDGGDGINTLGETIDLGAGTNRLIVLNSTDVTPDRDEAFESVKGATILQVDGTGAKNDGDFFLGDDAYAAGIKILETTPGSITTVETGLGFGGFTLLVNLGLESSLKLENGSQANNDLEIVSVLDAVPTGGGQVDGDDDVTLNLVRAGSGTVNLTLTIDDETPTWITTAAVAGSNGMSELSLDVDKASGIDRIKLVDNNIDFNVVGAYEPGLGDADNANVYVVTDSSWAAAALTIDASGIDNFDNVSATGAVVLDGSAEGLVSPAVLTLIGSANDNTLVGGSNVNNLTGGGGNDMLIGGNAADLLTGAGGNDTLYGNKGSDVLDGGLGNDYLVGGAGSDDLTGGGGSDIFDYQTGSDSGTAPGAQDIIRDFDFKVDSFFVSKNIANVGAVIIQDLIGAATPANLFTFLASRSEIQTAFALPGANAMLVTILSPNFAGGGINGADGDVTLMLIENGFGPQQNTFDSSDIMIQLDDDSSYANPGWFSLANFGPFGDGTALTAPVITGFVVDSNIVGDNITNDKDLQISGTSAVGATIRLWIDADGDGFRDWNEKSFVVTDAGDGFTDGKWTVGATGVLADGNYSFVAEQTVTGVLGSTFTSAGSKALDVVVDTTAPTVTITFSDTTLTAGETAVVTYQFDEAVDGFDATDITAENGTLTAFTQVDADTFTAVFTPTVAQDFTNVATVIAATYTDVAGNAGLGGVSDNYIIDSQTPSVLSIVFSDTALIAGETAVVTVDFDEPVTGFDLLDMTVENGTLSGFTVVDPDTYTAIFTPTAGVEDATNVAAVIAGTYTDIAGNAGGGLVSGNYTIDTLVPTLTITFDDTQLLKGETANVTFQFSEDVAGFAVGDVAVENGTLSTFVTVDANTYTAVFTPNTPVYDLTNVATVAGGTYTDIPGNLGAAGTSANYEVDTRAIPAIASANYDAANNVINLVGTGFSDYVSGDAIGFQWLFDGTTAYTFAASDIIGFNIVGDTLIQVVLAGGTASLIENDPAYAGGNDLLFVDAPFLVDLVGNPDSTTDLTLPLI